MCTPGACKDQQAYSPSKICIMPKGGRVFRKYISPATSTYTSLEVQTNLRIQFLCLIISSHSAPDAPEIFDPTYVTLYSKKLRGTISSNSLYLLKAEHQGYPTWGILVSGCFTQRKFPTGHPVFVQTPPRGRQTPPMHAVMLNPPPPQAR